MNSEIRILQNKIEYEQREIRDAIEHIGYLRNEIERNTKNIADEEFKINMHKDLVAHLESAIESIEKEKQA